MAHRPVVYFARAVDGLDRDEVLRSAVELADELDRHGLSMLDPVAMWMNGSRASSDHSALVESDLAILSTSDAVLVDMTIPGRSYVGCVGELVYAHLWGKPTVVWVGDTGLQERPWLRYHASVVVRTRGEAVSALLGLLPLGSADRELKDQQNDGDQKTEGEFASAEDAGAEQDKPGGDQAEQGSGSPLSPDQPANALPTDADQQPTRCDVEI